MQESPKSAFLVPSEHVGLPARLAELRAKGDIRRPYEANELPNYINRLIRVYKSQQEEYERISMALEAGIFQLTIHSRPGAMVVPISREASLEIGMLLQNAARDEIAKTVENIELARVELAGYLVEGQGRVLVEFQAEALYEQMLTTPVGLYAPAFPERGRHEPPPKKPQGHHRRRDRRKGR